MSAQIPSTESTPALGGIAPVERLQAAAKTAAGKTDPAVYVDTVPATPPAEVLDQIDAAAALYDRLAAGGTTVSFGADGATVSRPDGSSRRLTLADAARLASGELALEEL